MSICQEGRNEDGHHTRGPMAGTTKTNTPVHRPRTAVPQENTSFQDLRVLPQRQAAATPAWTCGVDRCRILTLLAGGISDTYAVSH